MIKSNLKELLDARKLSIREFAQKIDYRFETVRRFYNDTLVRVPMELIERCCLELGCDVNELIVIEGISDTQNGKDDTKARC